MSNPPSNLLPILDRFGPHLNRSSPVRLATDAEPDRLVKTHCCFCGQQCGIQLKVKDNVVTRLRAVVRLPVQPRHALPQGVKRYLQGPIRIGC
jgi:assimilatory nitrate reductase catalytic subunit